MASEARPLEPTRDSGLHHRALRGGPLRGRSRHGGGGASLPGQAAWPALPGGSAGASLAEMQAAGRRRSPAMPGRYAQGQPAKQGAVKRLRYGR